MRIDLSKVFTAVLACLIALASASYAHASDFTIGGTVSGVTSGNSGTLLDNGGNSLKVTANGKFTFTTALANGAAYSVTVGTEPTGETCTVTAGSGTVGTANVTTVKVACKATTHTIGGTASGLLTGRSVTLLDNGGSTLKVAKNGAFTFKTALASGAAYKVTVGTQAAGETCTVTKGSGTVGTSNVTNVAVACTPNTYTIGGKLSGLGTSDAVTLLDNGGNTLKLTANGTFTFTTPVASGSAYKVTISVQPTGETCTVTKGTGTVVSANVTTVVVTCKVLTYTIGGTVSGLTGGASVTLLNNGANALTVTANGTFTFTTALDYGAAYDVTVGTQPTGESCTVTGGSGTVTKKVTTVKVACKASSTTFTIGGTVSGLNTSTSVTLLDNGTNSLKVTANGSFTFTTKLASGATYSVTVGTQPTGETCTVTNGSGTVGSANVTNVAVACSSGTGGGGAYWIPYSASPAPDVTPAGSTGLFLIPSDKLASSPAPTFITTDNTSLLAIGTQISVKDGVLTYSPQLMMYADTASTGITKIFGLTLAGTSSVPTPIQIGSLALPSTQVICPGSSSAETNIAEATSLFVVIEVGTATQCDEAGGTYEVVHYQASSTTAPAVVNLNTTTTNTVYQNSNLTGLLVFDSATNSLDLYADDTFTSPTKEISGLQNGSYVSGVLDEATLSTSGVFYSATTTGGVTDLYRIDGSTLAATLIQNLMTGTVSTAVQDDTNLYYMVLTSGASSTTATFNQVALTGGTPKLLYTSPPFVPEGTAGLAGYQLVGSNDSVVAFEFYSEPLTGGSLDPTKATATLYTVPVGETTTTPTTLANYPAGDLLTNVFLSAPSGSGLSASVLFVTVRKASGSISAPTIAYSAVSIPLNGGTAPAPIANSAYEQLAVVSPRLTYNVWQVIGITDTNGGWGGGTAYSVNVSTLVDTPFTTTGGADYVFGKGFSGGFAAISSPNIAIGILENSSAASGGATLVEDGAAVDLTTNFLYPVVLTNTYVLPY